MEKSVENKVILVTGGATGLGLAMADNFLKKCAKLLIILDINEEEGANAIKTLESKHGEEKAVFYKCDVTSDLEEIFKTVIDKYDYVDVVVNNAGILNEKSIKKTIDVNTTAVMEWTMRFYDQMRQDKGGRGGTIINVSSIYGYRLTPYMPYYHASKFAVKGFSESIGHEYNYKRTGVRVVTLCPGLTHTNITSDPQPRDVETQADFHTDVRNNDWQEPDAIGKGIIEIFEKAHSGESWLVEGSRPAVRI